MLERQSCGKNSVFARNCQQKPRSKTKTTLLSACRKLVETDTNWTRSTGTPQTSAKADEPALSAT